MKQKSKQTPQRKGRSKKKAEDQSEAKVQTNTTAGACCGNQLAAEASAGAWRFPERIAVAVDLRQHRRKKIQDQRTAAGSGYFKKTSQNCRVSRKLGKRSQAGFWAVILLLQFGWELKELKLRVKESQVPGI